MCLSRQLDATSRRIKAAASFCLITGLSLAIFFKDTAFALHHPDSFLALRFVLICGAIVLMLWSSHRSGGCTVLPESNS